MRTTIQSRPSPLGPVLTFAHEVDRPRLGLVPVFSEREYRVLTAGRVAWAWEHALLARAVWPGAEVVQVHDMERHMAKQARRQARTGFERRREFVPEPAEEE